MTRKEFDLLAFLASAPGRVFSREDLLERVWGSNGRWQGRSTVTEHIRRVRLKIETDPENPRWITTIRGIGYRFAAPAQLRRRRFVHDGCGSLAPTPARVTGEPLRLPGALCQCAAFQAAHPARATSTTAVTILIVVMLISRSRL